MTGAKRRLDLGTAAYVFCAACSVTLAWLIFGLATSCKSTLPPEPDVVVTESGTGAYTCMTAAENLHEIGCAEAADAGAFAQVCAHNQAESLIAMDVKCMSFAATKEAARACINVGCP